MACCFQSDTRDTVEPAQRAAGLPGCQLGREGPGSGGPPQLGLVIRNKVCMG